MKYKVLITTSGAGSRLGEITKYTNKALVKVGKKPAISYIIESYPKNTEFVVTLGYFGNQVRDFLELAYPDKKFIFVKVDKFEGKGSSLGYSMLQAEKYLQCPFIFNAADTIISSQKIPAPSNNWIGGYRGEGSSQYASFDLVEGRVNEIYDKGMLDPDFLHIGLVGVNNYRDFWVSLRKKQKLNPNDSTLNDVSALNDMLKKGIGFEAKEFKVWHDIGNVESLQKTRLEIKDSFRILDKVDESISIFDKFVVKFFYDKKITKDRVARGKILKGLVPEIEDSRENFYRYKYAKGHLYSKVATPHNFKFFLDWAGRKLWKENKEVDQKKFKEICYDFYYKKSIERIEKFLSSRLVKDQKTSINGENVPTVKEMFKRIDFNWLCDSQQSNFHGDFILDNIIQTKNGFCLLDWRQNFGGLLKSGDMYYDLAKLNHNLTVNHEIVNKNLFTININKNVVECDILRKDNLVQCQKVLFDFLKKENYDEKRVRILTAIIWLNMSPLHHHPFDLFLFYFGKLNLWRELKKQ
jgi:dTDP-glucose pyrophosphorylase